jgi:nicotinate-nucleotide pyrophosphorylase (carboxylating)
VAAVGADQILLDNMDPEMIRTSIESIRRIERERSLRPAMIEVSGGVTLETIRSKAVPGVNFISVGALTHSARALDLSLELELLHPNDLARGER